MNRKGYLVIQSFTFAFCLCFVIYQALDCFQRYFDRPEVVDFSYVSQNKVPFPDLTLCPADHRLKKIGNMPPVAYKQDVLEQCNFTQFADLWMQPCRNMLENAWPTWPQFGIEDIIIHTWNDDQFDMSYMTIKEHLHLMYGKCFTLSIAKDILKDGVWFIEIIRKRWPSVLSLTFHTPGAFKDPFNGIGGITLILMPTMVVHYRIEHEAIKLLDYDGQPCLDQKEFNLDQCFIDYVDQKTLETLGCTSPFGSLKNVSCPDFETASAALKIYKNELLNGTHCSAPCETLWSRIIHSNVDDLFSLKPKATILFQKFIKRSESRYSYKAINLLGELGGHIGLFLGMSVMQLPSVISWIMSKQTLHFAF